MTNLQIQYIDLLLNKCIYPKSNSLFISYDKCNADFINKLIKKARDYGYKNILTNETDIVLERQLLNELSPEEIKSHPYFCNDNWNKAIHENCAFLLASTTFPNAFEGIAKEKLIAANQAKTKTREKYMESVMNDSISWTIFGLPNRAWAENLFPRDENSYEKLEKLIYSFCMIESGNAVDKWNHYITVEKKKTAYLNDIKIKQLVLKNSLGTNLTMRLADGYIFRSLENNHCIENIPTYSIWTTPHKYHVEGIVYGSMPITYGGYTIENYWFKLSEGKVTEYGASKGKEYLDEYFAKNDSYKRLGEIAIIDYNSPIARTKITYNNNLFDENVATHLAFGCAYQNTIINGSKMSKEQLDKAGCNVCPEHMDFTIGTEDLSIIATTHDDKEIEIFQQGNFNYDLIGETSPFADN